MMAGNTRVRCALPWWLIDCMLLHPSVLDARSWKQSLDMSGRMLEETDLCSDWKDENSKGRV
jgi:hypothetical protein